VPLTPSVDGWSIERPVAHSFPSQPVHVTAFELGLKIFKVLAHLRQLGRINERPELQFKTSVAKSNLSIGSTRDSRVP
jgi:hypothetical protein